MRITSKKNEYSPGFKTKDGKPVQTAKNVADLQRKEREAEQARKQKAKDRM